MLDCVCVINFLIIIVKTKFEEKAVSAILNLAPVLRYFRTGFVDSHIARCRPCTNSLYID